MQTKKYKTLLEQLKHDSQGYQNGPSDYSCEALPGQIFEMNARHDDFGKYNTIIFPSCLVNGDSSSQTNHVMFRRLKSQDKQGRFKPEFQLKLGSFKTIDARFKDSGLIAKVVEADILDREFFPTLHDMLNNKFGNNFLMVPAQVALYGSDDQFAKKSYIIYHDGIIKNAKPYANYQRDTSNAGPSTFRFYFDK